MYPYHCFRNDLFDQYLLAAIVRSMESRTVKLAAGYGNIPYKTKTHRHVIAVPPRIPSFFWATRGGGVKNFTIYDADCEVLHSIQLLSDKLSQYATLVMQLIFCSLSYHLSPYLHNKVTK